MALDTPILSGNLNQINLDDMRRSSTWYTKPAGRDSGWKATSKDVGSWNRRK